MDKNGFESWLSSSRVNDADILLKREAIEKVATKYKSAVMRSCAKSFVAMCDEELSVRADFRRLHAA